VASDWRALVDAFFQSETGGRLGSFVQQRLDSGAVIYPPHPLRALELTALADVRVVILGQDPYHGSGQAEGLAFSVAVGQKLPPSLRNIFKELRRDLGVRVAGDGSLMRWAQQGVLLLNTSLTVEAGQPASHASRGWEVLTDAIIAAVSRVERPVVFMLWGAHAQRKRALIDASPQRPRHRVLVANHPSPLSASRPPLPFLGCGHFREANVFLTGRGLVPLLW
jgi:uracil-DNA glycosylase